MTPTTFRDFIAELGRIGDLKVLKDCDWDLEIGTLTELMAERWGPAESIDLLRGFASTSLDPRLSPEQKAKRCFHKYASYHIRSKAI